MMINLPLPQISPKFTIDDIHTIREWNYERRKNMTRTEILEDIRHGAEEFKKLLSAK